MPATIDTQAVHAEGVEEFRTVLRGMGYREGRSLESVGPGQYVNLGWSKFARSGEAGPPVPADMALIALGGARGRPTFVKVHSTQCAEVAHTSAWRSVALAAELSGRDANLLQVFMGPSHLNLLTKFPVLNDLLSKQFKKTGSAQVVCRLEQFTSGESSVLLARGIHLQA